MILATAICFAVGGLSLVRGIFGLFVSVLVQLDAARRATANAQLLSAAMWKDALLIGSGFALIWLGHALNGGL